MIKTISRTLLVLLIACSAQAQTINTIAGTGSAGFSGDSSSATAAELNQPYSIAQDPAGNIYFSDRSNNVVRKISTSGIITTVAGTGIAGYSGDNGPAVSAELHAPSGLTIDNSGNLFICDCDNGCIRKVDGSGTITTFAGSATIGFSGDGGLATSAQLNQPIDIAIDNAGNVLIVDQLNSRIRLVNASNIITTIAGPGNMDTLGDGGPATLANLQRPNGIAIDAVGNIYVSDFGNNRVRKIDSAGVISTFAGTGAVGLTGDGAAATAAELHFPTGLGFDSSGNLYIADQLNYVIRQVDVSGIITTIAGTGVAGFGGDGGPATSAQLRFPCDVLVSGSGEIYIADNINNRVRKIDQPTFLYNVNPGNELQLFPNANNGLFTLSGAVPTKKSSVQIEVLDITGKVISTDISPVQNGKINKQITLTENVPAGQYLIKVVTENGSSSLKFEKK